MTALQVPGASAEGKSSARSDNFERIYSAFMRQRWREHMAWYWEQIAEIRRGHERITARPLIDVLSYLRSRGSSDGDIALRLGTTRRTVQRLWNLSTIRITEADKYACRLGYHPVELWGHDFEVAA